MSKQLTLGVGLRDDATFANYYTGHNAQLIAALNQAARGQGERFIYLRGSGGDGCTHLLQACCHEAARAKMSAGYLPLRHLIDYSPSVFEGLENLSVVCVDDLHLLAHKKHWQEAFFHAYNRIRDTNANLIVTANVMPQALAFELPDLVSRLNWGMSFQILSLTDTDKLQALIMRAQLRGLNLSEEVAKFILTHCPRHMSTLFAALDALDKASLAAQRKLTIPFVKMVLQI